MVRTFLLGLPHMPSLWSEEAPNMVFAVHVRNAWASFVVVLRLHLGLVSWLAYAGDTA